MKYIHKGSLMMELYIQLEHNSIYEGKAQGSLNLLNKFKIKVIFLKIVTNCYSITRNPSRHINGIKKYCHS